jgi:hypothetical protein
MFTLCFHKEFDINNRNNFLTLIYWHLTPMVNFLPGFMIEKTTSIFPYLDSNIPLPRM